ncbi:MAG TPA: hypothetical protein VJB16_04915, partial [archaeon]|nr:hypothetical protein [archaeon]
LNARVQNKGNATATGVWLAWNLSPGWTISQGERNKSIGTLAVDAIANNQVNVTIADDASTGTKTITALAGSSEDKSGSAAVDVAVIARAEEEEEESPSTDTGGGGAGGGGGSGGGGGGPVTPQQRDRLLQTSETFELVRGSQQSFPLRVENPFGGILRNVTVTLSGFLAQYLSVQPRSVDALRPNESYDFTVSIGAPEYFTEGDHNLTFLITGVVVTTLPLPEGQAVTLRTFLRENRSVSLVIQEIPRDEASVLQDASGALLSELASLGLPTQEAEQLLATLVREFDQKRYGAVRATAQRIRALYDQAMQARGLIAAVQQDITRAEFQGLRVAKTKRLLLLAEAALQRGDFSTALQRAEDARVTLALETVGKFNYLIYLENNWETLAAAAFAASIAAWLLFLAAKYFLLGARLKHLRKEERIMIGLIQEVQRDCFERHKLGVNEYLQTLQQYEQRLSDVVQQSVQLEIRRANVFRLFHKASRELLQERKQLLALVQQMQRLYVESGKLDTRVYQNRMRSYVKRLAELEEHLAELEARRARRRRWGRGSA